MDEYDEYMVNGKLDILSLSKEELKIFFTDELGLKSYRADQVRSWLNKSLGDIEFFQMGNIPKTERKIFEDNLYIDNPKIIKKQISSDGTIKYLLELRDKNTIESVFMRYIHGNTVCISTQVGCRMSCAFCASAAGGLSRNLLPSEMLSQLYVAWRDTGEKISNVVLMGIGEPLDNFDNVLKFLELVNSPDGPNIGYRHISLSTCGLVDKMQKLKEKKIPLTLSVSLHAAENETRKKLMPISGKWSIDKLLDACREYANFTKRRISFEYILIDNINDSEQDAMLLAKKTKNILCHINLILLNETAENNFKPLDMKKAQRFKDTLERFGANATIRRKCGRDIEASCGQLRKNNLKT